MLKIMYVAGNIFCSNDSIIQDKNFEKLRLTRTELEKTRMRKKTDLGTDIGLILEPGTTLNNGDILTDGERTVVVEQMPEKVIRLVPKDSSADILVLIGHIIGNRHRPISIEDGVVYFPIQSETELEVFEKLLVKVIDKVKLSVEERIFTPHTGADVHDH